MGKKQQLPDAVLFACNQNAIRSPMAESILKHILGDRIYVDSCGLVASEIDPFVLAVMDEINIDLSRHKAKSFDNLADTSFNLIVALTPESLECANEFTRAISVAVEYWPTSNPSETTGNREHKLDAYRRVRDDLIKQIQKRFETDSETLPNSAKHVKRKP